MLVVIALALVSMFIETNRITDIIVIFSFLLIPFMGLFGFLIYKAHKTTKISRIFSKYPAGIGRAIDDISADKEGYIIISGEYWKAKSSIYIKAGSEIMVVGHHNSNIGILSVEPIIGKHKDTWN